MSTIGDRTINVYILPGTMAGEATIGGTIFANEPWPEDFFDYTPQEQLHIRSKCYPHGYYDRGMLFLGRSN